MVDKIMSRDNRKQVRLTDTEMASFTAHCGAMGIAPGTMLRHLVLGWLAQRSATAIRKPSVRAPMNESEITEEMGGPIGQCKRCSHHYFADMLTNGLCYQCAEEVNP
jgi:hypothetical protein